MTHLYATNEYACTLFHIGKPFFVPEWGTSVLLRPIGENYDVIGPYPLSILSHQVDLVAGLARLQDAGFISVTLVLDDFHRPSLEELGMAFDLVRPYKSHYIIDLRREQGLHPPLSNRHHRYEIKKSRERVYVKKFELADKLDEWISLYHGLVFRHTIEGIHLFPKEHHQLLANCPDVTAIGAFNKENELLACHLWVNSDGIYQSHLAASSPEGYACKASYAVNDESIGSFIGGKIINLGGGAGNLNNEKDGLSIFKKGFANGVAQSYICGAILDARRYAALAGTVVDAFDFFPTYRSPGQMR